MKILSNITLGADPEVFVKHSITGNFIPAYLIIENYSKNNPLKIREGYYILHDNATLEGNIPSANNKCKFVDNMKTLVEIFTKYITDKNPALELSYQDSAEFEPNMLDYAAAKVFGCAPYKNAYDGKEHTSKDISDVNYRVAGAHIHLGYKSAYSKEKLNPIIAKAFDLFLTVPSKAFGVDKFRDSNYGGYGQYRDKDYGLECRSLGGLMFNPKFQPKIYDNIMKMIDFINSFSDVIELVKAFEFIDKYNIEKYSNKIYKKFNINYSELLFN